MNTLIKTFSVKTIMCGLYFVYLFCRALHAVSAIHSVRPSSPSTQLTLDLFQSLEFNSDQEESDSGKEMQGRVLNESAKKLRPLNDLIAELNALITIPDEIPKTISEAIEPSESLDFTEQVEAITTKQQDISESIFELIASNGSFDTIEDRLKALEPEYFLESEYKKGYRHFPILLEEGDSILHAAIRCGKKEIIRLILHSAQEKGVQLDELLNTMNRRGITPLKLAESIAPNLLPLLQSPSSQSYRPSSSSSSFSTTSSSARYCSPFFESKHSSISRLDSLSLLPYPPSSTLSPCSSCSGLSDCQNPSCVYAHKNCLPNSPSRRLHSSKKKKRKIAKDCEHPSIQNLEKALEEKNDSLVQKILRKAPYLANTPIGNFKITPLRFAALQERKEKDKPLQCTLLSSGANPWDASASDIADLDTRKLITQFQEKAKIDMYEKAYDIIIDKSGTNKKNSLEKLFQKIEGMYGKNLLTSFINYQDPEEGTTLLHLLENEGNIELYSYLIEKGADPFIKSYEDLMPINITHKLSPLQRENILKNAIKTGLLSLVQIILYNHPEILKNHGTYNELISDGGISFLSAPAHTHHRYKQIITFIVKNEDGLFFLNYRKASFLHSLFDHLTRSTINSNILDQQTRSLLKDIFDMLKQSALLKIIYQRSGKKLPFDLIDEIMEWVGYTHCYSLRPNVMLDFPSPEFKNKTPLDLLPLNYPITRAYLESEGFTYSPSLSSSSGSSSRSKCHIQ